MAVQSYVQIQGAVQGDITAQASSQDSIGEDYVEGEFQDMMAVQAFSHQILKPTNPLTGQPTGQRVHQPLVMTTTFNKAVPLLFNALASGEALPSVTIHWPRINPITATKDTFFTIELTDALVSDIKIDIPHVADGSKSQIHQEVKISLSYAAIKWTHVDANSEGSDSWRTA